MRRGMRDLAATRQRWARLTDQDIGEAQTTIQALLEALEAAVRVVKKADQLQRWANVVAPSLWQYEDAKWACIDGEGFAKEMHEALTAFRAQVGG